MITNQQNTITFARSILALGTLLTLILNDLEYFNNVSMKYSKINIFNLFENIELSYYISILALVLCIIGLYPRYTSILQGWISFSTFHALSLPEGGDQITSILTILLIPVCILDNRKNGWSTNDVKTKNNILKFNALCALFVIKLQVFIVYFHAGISKIFEEQWYIGTATYYWFNNSFFGANTTVRLMFENLFNNVFTVTLITWGTIFLEIFLAISFFIRNQNIKYILFSLSFVFHFLILLVFGLSTFFLAMLGSCVLYLLDTKISINRNFNEIIKSWKYYIDLIIRY